jgi:hypothetical protein
MGSPVTVVTEEKKQNKVANGEAYYAAWHEWCEQKGIEPSIESLQNWDEKHNGGRIRAAYTDDEIWKAGIYEIYHRFFYTYSMHFHRGKDGKRINLATIRVIDDEGTFGFVESCDSEAKEFILARLKARVKADSRRLTLLGMEWGEVRREILAAYREARKVEKTNR